jgi:hypothetical protein
VTGAAADIPARAADPGPRPLRAPSSFPRADARDAGTSAFPGGGVSDRARAADLTPEELCDLIERAVENGVARALARNGEGVDDL